VSAHEGAHTQVRPYNSFSYFFANKSVWLNFASLSNNKAFSGEITPDAFFLKSF
jgi:hypothetical protein